MHKSKIINLLKTFSDKELKSFELFLNSPFFNSNADLIVFFVQIKKTLFKLENSNLSKKNIFKILYPQMVYSDQKLRYLMSDLLKLAEQFLMAQKIKKPTLNLSLQLLEEFSTRNLNKHYTHLKNKITHDIDKHKIINIEYYLKKVRIAGIEEKHFHTLHHRLFDDKIQEGSDALNRFFALKKLKYVCAMLNRQALFKENYNIDMPSNWIEWMEANNFWNENLIKIYADVFLTLKNPERPIYFERLNELLLSKNTNASLKDLKELYLYSINYCSQKIRQGKNQYIEKALKLYLAGIKDGALLEGKYFSPWSFGNVVKLALRLEKYDWIEQFMEDHKKHLPPEFRKNTMLYNYAELYCYKKDFNKALDLLNKVVFSDLSYQLGSRIMLSKIYYELKEETALLSLFSSFMMFLKRNKQISESSRNICLNFCNILSLITKGKTTNLKEKINNTPLLADRNWLLEKLAEINHTHKQ